MKLKIYYCSVFLFLIVSAQAQTLQTSNLPIMIMDTYGQTINDSIRKIVNIGLIDHGYGNINNVNDTFNDFHGDVSIEIRGSTSQQYPKKSYGFSPVDSLGNSINRTILGMPNENDWIMYAPYPDKTLMRNTLCYYLANRMGHYASRTKHYELVRDGNYRGVYELLEKIKRDNNRVDIAKLTVNDTIGDELTGGYILKIDKITSGGVASWYSPYDASLYFQHHEPEEDEILPVQRTYIQNFITSFEAALISPLFTDVDSGYARFINQNSFIDFIILQELGRTVDGYRSSTFMYKDKDSNGGKLNMGPMWDFNLSFGNADYCNAYLSAGWQYDANSYCLNRVPDVPFWFGRMLQDSAFADSLHCRWTNLRETFLNTDTMNQWIDSVALYLDESQQRNFVKWPILGTYVNWNYFVGNTYQEEVDFLKSWIEQRSLWIDSQWSNPACIIHVGLEESVEPVVKIYPNPATDKIHITLLAEKENPCTLHLFDSMGRQILEESLVANKNLINTSSLSRGIYVYSIQNKTGIARGKILLQ